MLRVGDWLIYRHAMQLMDGLFDDLRVLEKEQQLELQELENEPMELEIDASSSNAVPAATQTSTTHKQNRMHIRRANSEHWSYHAAITSLQNDRR